MATLSDPVQSPPRRPPIVQGAVTLVLVVAPGHSLMPVAGLFLLAAGALELRAGLTRRPG